MTEQSEPAFLAVVYHDEPEDAATDNLARWASTLEQATSWAREQMHSDPYWNAFPSTIHSGFVVRDRDLPPRWEDDDEHLWLVYADSIEQER